MSSDLRNLSVGLLILAVITIPLIGEKLYSRSLDLDYFHNIDMENRTPTDLSGPILYESWIGAHYENYNTWNIVVTGNATGKRMRIVEPPDYGAFFPIAGNVRDGEISGENFTMVYRANDCVPTDILVYNNTTFSHATIPQRTICM